MEELDVQGLLCAGKKLHDVFFEPENQPPTRILERFVEECTLLSGLHHTHIVQFLGICYLDGSDSPVLVMEYLPYCLHNQLEVSLLRLLECPDTVKLTLTVAEKDTPALGTVGYWVGNGVGNVRQSCVCIR